jgi:RNA polymerase sigma-19 factor, ECF subfamily
MDFPAAPAAAANGYGQAVSETTLLQQQVHLLYSEHQGWLYGWLRKKLGSADNAAELLHDTFLRILSKQRALESLREPRAYLSTIAHGLVVNHWRRLALEQAYLAALAAQPEPLAPSPEEQQLALDALQQIDRILRGLSPRVREIFLLSQLDGLSYPQIAAQLEVSVNLVQKAMLRAVKHVLTVQD